MTGCATGGEFRLLTVDPTEVSGVEDGRAGMFAGCTEGDVMADVKGKAAPVDVNGCDWIVTGK